ILGHLQDTEVVYGYRLRFSLAQPGSPLVGYDQAVWTERLRHRRANAKRLVDRIRVLREGNLDMLGQVPRPRWKKAYGMHSDRRAGRRAPSRASLRPRARGGVRMPAPSRIHFRADGMDQPCPLGSAGWMGRGSALRSPRRPRGESRRNPLGLDAGVRRSERIL